MDTYVLCHVYGFHCWTLSIPLRGMYKEKLLVFGVFFFVFITVIVEIQLDS